MENRNDPKKELMELKYASTIAYTNPPNYSFLYKKPLTMAGRYNQNTQQEIIRKNIYIDPKYVNCTVKVDIPDTISKDTQLLPINTKSSFGQMNRSDFDMSTGGKVGLGVGCLVLLIIIAVVFMMMKKKKAAAAAAKSSVAAAFGFRRRR